MIVPRYNVCTDTSRSFNLPCFSCGLFPKLTITLKINISTRTVRLVRAVLIKMRFKIALYVRTVGTYVVS